MLINDRIIRALGTQKMLKKMVESIKKCSRRWLKVSKNAQRFSMHAHKAGDLLATYAPALLYCNSSGESLMKRCA
jgi:hypothetical protein